VGALLTDEAKEWHFARDDLISLDQGGQDNRVAYSEAIVNEYTDPREGAVAHDKLKALKYKGDIKAYLTGFTTLNRSAGSNGEGLQDIINQVLPDEIIDVRLYQNPRALVTDQEFLTAIYEAGQHVETLKALKARKAGKTTSGPTPKPKDGKNGKDGQSSEKTGKAANSQGEQKGSKQTGKSGSGSKTERSGESWGSLEEALRGVPAGEQEAFKATSEHVGGAAGPTAIAHGLAGRRKLPREPRSHGYPGRSAPSATERGRDPWSRNQSCHNPSNSRPRQWRPWTSRN
jgi:hypothetical protein